MGQRFSAVSLPTWGHVSILRGVTVSFCIGFLLLFGCELNCIEVVLGDGNCFVVLTVVKDIQFGEKCGLPRMGCRRACFHPTSCSS